MSENEDVKGALLDELLNTRVYLLNRMEILDSLLLEYIAKEDMCNSMNKENQIRFLTGCVSFHKSFKQIKGTTSRLMRILGGEEDCGVDLVSTTSPQKMKMKTKYWIDVKHYLSGIKSEDEKFVNE